METISLPPLDLDIELDPRELAGPDVPLPIYIVAKRLAQQWIAQLTQFERDDAITILDLASGDGEFSDIVCDFATAQDKLAVWVDQNEDELREGQEREKTFRVETLVADLNQDEWSVRLAGRRFDRITLGLAHHFIGDDRYREILATAMTQHLAPGGLALIVEVCSGLYEGITRETVLPHLQGSIPSGMRPVVGTPKLIHSTVRNPRSKREWTIEYFAVALAMPVE